MPFDPRVIRSDDLPPPTHLLPPVLEALGQQLADDADLLARCYPADDPLASGASTRPPIVRPPSRWPRPLGGHRVAAAAVLLVALGSVCAWQGLYRPPGGPATQTAARPPQTSVRPVPQSPPDQAPLPRGAALPTTVFQDLSGPEQEAVLDLLERDLYSSASLSI